MVKWYKICFVRLPILLKLCLNNSYLIIQGTVSNQIVTKCVYVCVHLTGMKLTCVNKNSSRVTLLDIENLVTKNSVQFQLKNSLKNAKELRTHGKHVPPAEGTAKWISGVFLGKSLGSMWKNIQTWLHLHLYPNFTFFFIDELMQWHSTPVLLAWKIPWTEEPGELQSRVAKSQTWLSDFTFTFHFHALEKEMATHSSVLVWRIPGMGSHRVGHDWSDLAVM